ncbi:hypothetical protein [Candidatus Magnetomonas plexicatena]|uniref:hypothetical protein n=1 Tax=Candidatus Magnetomonas plexicatena TaxID=2552947 RepID=UPI001104429B|nr:hypothetical protein E2O03_011435 [Nitrospirales bacterium LBB_01]
MANPLIVCIGGAYSGSGKTSLAVELLKNLKGSWAAIKYTKTSFYTSVTDAADLIHQESKDSTLLLKAGAVAVKWVQSPYSTLDEALRFAMFDFPQVNGIIIEGNSPLDFVKPDITIFLMGADTGRFKETAEKFFEKSDIAVVFQTSEDYHKIKQWPEGMKTCTASVYNSGEPNFDECTKMIMETMKTKEMQKRLLERVTDGRVSCASARALAEELEIPYKELGAEADKLNVKIKSCDLGCF